MLDVDEKHVTDRVAAILGKRLDIDPTAIDPDALIEDSFGVDSMDVLSIVAQVETQFDVDIPQDAIPEVRSMRGLVQVLLQRLPGGAAFASSKEGIK